METYRRQHEALSLCDHLASAEKVSFFFQFAEKDEYVTLARAQALFGAPTGAKQMSVYGGAEHAMTAPAGIRADRTAWLARELRIEPGSGR
jgi:dienelactone hydrolase